MNRINFPLTLDQLIRAALIAKQKYGGDKYVLISDDEEGNGYHECYFSFGDAKEFVSEYDICHFKIAKPRVENEEVVHTFILSFKYDLAVNRDCKGLVIKQDSHVLPNAKVKLAFQRCGKRSEFSLPPFGNI